MTIESTQHENRPVQPRDELDDLPLRQIVTADPHAAPVFARQGVLEWLSRPERYQVIGHGDGAQILAAGEAALAEAQGMLREAYGAAIRFGSPTVHSYIDEATGARMVPLVFMRLDAPRTHIERLQRLLARRSADVKEVELQHGRVVFRAEMDLSLSLGIEGEVLEATGGAAQILSWLLRYEAARG